MFNNNKDKYTVNDESVDVTDDVTIALKPSSETEFPAGEVSGKSQKFSAGPTAINSILWKVIPATVLGVLAVALFIGLTYYMCCSGECNARNTILKI